MVYLEWLKNKTELDNFITFIEMRSKKKVWMHYVLSNFTASDTVILALPGQSVP